MKRSIWIDGKGKGKSKHYVGKTLKFQSKNWRVIKVWSNRDLSLVKINLGDDGFYEGIYRVDPEIIENNRILPPHIKMINDSSWEERIIEGTL